jgi:3,4-dihydroxy 2-butanone 4-phosphate synthase/GTP cyclohydrolase II
MTDAVDGDKTPPTEPVVAPPQFGPKSVVAAIEAIKQGKLVVVTDDESRENEGDLIMAAECATPANVGFIVRYTSGVICCAVKGDRLDELELPPMVVNNQDPKQTAFTVSVDYKVGTTTGISAADRAATFRALANPTSVATDFNRPGHVFPLRPREGGVLERDGHTEASVDLCKMAGLTQCGVLSEICNDDGSMSRVPELRIFCEKHGLVLTSIHDMQEYLKAQK